MLTLASRIPISFTTSPSIGFVWDNKKDEKRSMVTERKDRIKVWELSLMLYLIFEHLG